MRNVLLGALSLALLSAPPFAVGHDGTVLSGIGSATIDGVLSTGEWMGASQVTFELTTLGQVHPTTVLVMNDETDLFVAVVIRNEDYKPSEFGIQGDILTILFDNDHDGGIGLADAEHGDDFVQAQIGFAPGPFSPSARDGFHCFPPVCTFPTVVLSDASFVGGESNVEIAISHSNPTPGEIGDYVYEIRKELNSGDGYDFSLDVGSTVGFLVHFVDTPLGQNGGSPAIWPGPDECLLFGSNVPCEGADIAIARQMGVHFLMIDEDSIDNATESIQDISFNAPFCGGPLGGVGNPGVCVNDDIADPAVRTPLFSRPLENPVPGGTTVVLPTGRVGDEALFRFGNPDPQVSLQGTPTFSTQEFITATGAAADENNLDKIVNVLPLSEAEIAELEGETVCALVYDSDISGNTDPPYASLKGANLGLTAFRVTAINPNPNGGSNLPLITVELVSSDEVQSLCESVASL